MAKNNKIYKSDSTGVFLASGLAATLIGFSIAIITIMITKDGFLENYPNSEYMILLYVLTIIFFIFSREFLTLSTWDKKNYEIWIVLGSALYNFAYGWLIIGLSLTFDIMINSSFLAYSTLTLFLFFWIMYYIIRGIVTKEFFYNKARLIIRITMFLQIFIGYIAIYLLE